MIQKQSYHSHHHSLTALWPYGRCSSPSDVSVTITPPSDQASGQWLQRTRMRWSSLCVLGPIFTAFLLEPWSLAVGTLFQGLKSWDSVGDQSLQVSLLTCITITDVFRHLFAYFYHYASSVFILHSRSAIIKFWSPWSRNRAPYIVNGLPNHIHCVSKNAPTLKRYSWAQNYKDQFWWYLAEIEFVCFVFYQLFDFQTSHQK